MDEKVQHIMQSDLPNALQLTWIAMWGASTDGLYADSIAQVGRERGISRQAASKQVKRLIQWGVVEKIGNAYRLIDDVTPDVDDRNSGVDNVNQEAKGFPPHPPKKDNHSTPLTPPSQEVLVESADADRPPWLDWVDEQAWEAEDLPDDHPVNWDYHPGDWRFDFAELAIQRMREHDMISPIVENKISRQSEGAVAAEWADTFRKLVDLDGYSRDEVEDAMRWLFEGGNFWTDQGGIASIPTLRKKTRSGDRRKFDVIHQQAEAPQGDGAPADPTIQSGVPGRSVA